MQEKLVFLITEEGSAVTTYAQKFLRPSLSLQVIEFLVVPFIRAVFILMNLVDTEKHENMRKKVSARN